jgi:hypothetical protein
MKEARKKLEADVISAIEQTLSQQSQSIAGKMKKVVNASGKKIAKKFFKTVKAVAKEAAKQNGKAKAKRKPARRKRTASTLRVAKSAKARKAK